MRGRKLKSLSKLNPKAKPFTFVRNENKTKATDEHHSVSLHSLFAEFEEEIDEILDRILPTAESDQTRIWVYGYMESLISSIPGVLGVFQCGSTAVHTYLPDDSVDIGAFLRPDSQEIFFPTLLKQLELVQKKVKNNEISRPIIKDISFVSSSQEKRVTCDIGGMSVVTSANTINARATVYFLDAVSRHIAMSYDSQLSEPLTTSDLLPVELLKVIIGYCSPSNLFRKSVVLINAWCRYEARILGADEGLLSSFAITTMVLYIFNAKYSAIQNPFHVLYFFLECYSKFNFAGECVTVRGPTSLHSIYRREGKPIEPEYPLFSDQFWFKQQERFYTASKNPSSQFETKWMNVMDPLNSNNNIARSINRENFKFIEGQLKKGWENLQSGINSVLSRVPSTRIRFLKDTLFAGTWKKYELKFEGDEKIDKNYGRPDVSSYVDLFGTEEPKQQSRLTLERPTLQRQESTAFGLSGSSRLLPQQFRLALESLELKPLQKLANELYLENTELREQVRVLSDQIEQSKRVEEVKLFETLRNEWNQSTPIYPQMLPSYVHNPGSNPKLEWSMLPAYVLPSTNSNTKFEEWMTMLPSYLLPSTSTAKLEWQYKTVDLQSSSSIPQLPSPILSRSFGSPYYPIATRGPESHISTTESADLTKLVPRPIEASRRILGTSGTGVVYFGEYRGEPVAVKITIRKEHSVALQNEYKLMRNLNHTNIIPVIGYAEQLGTASMIMELAEHGSLFRILHNRKSYPTLPWSFRLSVAINITNALNYLHTLSPPIIHRDLKSGNILLRRDWTACLSDFELSTFVSENWSLTPHIGSTRWMAPEMLFEEERKKIHKPLAIDVYGIGLLLYELLTRNLPFQHVSDHALNLHIKEGKLRLPSQRVIKSSPQGYLKLLQECCHVNPDQRPNLTLIKQRLTMIHQQVVSKHGTSWPDHVKPKAADSTLLFNSTVLAQNNLRESKLLDLVPVDHKLEIIEPDTLFPQPGSDRRAILGRGSFGVIYRCKWKNKVVAVKTFVVPSEFKERIMLEFEKISRMEFGNVVQLYGYYNGEKLSYLVMELGDLGSLDSILTDDQTYPHLSWDWRLSIALHIAQGLNHLHSHTYFSLIPRNLRPSKILICSDGSAFISDFYLSNIKEILNPNNVSNSFQFMAPELFDSEFEDNPNPSLDIYAFGMMLFSLLTRKIPWAGCCEPEIILKLLGQERPSLPDFPECSAMDDVPIGFKDLMRSCWSQQPEERPKLMEIIKQIRLMLPSTKIDLKFVDSKGEVRNPHTGA